MIPTRAAVAALNHLLGGADWARERLRPFAGQHLRVVVGPLAVGLAVEGEGYFRPEPGPAEPAVVITLPADAPLRFLADRAGVLAAARLSGAADFAETLGFVFRNLQWDAEEDLARVVGDIAARRVVRGGRALLAWQQQAAANAGANLAEYLSEEASVLVPRREVDRFTREVQAVADQLERLEKRLPHR